MYFFLLIYLIINTSLTSSKTVYKVDGKRSAPDSRLSCKNIKCAPMEDPVCVKVTNIDKQKHQKFILAINKCNMQFMKCHPAGKKHDVSLCGMRKENVLRKISEDFVSDDPDEINKDKNTLLSLENDEKEQPADELGDGNNKEKRLIDEYDLGEEDKEERPPNDNDEQGDVNEKALIDRYDVPSIEDPDDNEKNLQVDYDNKESVGDNNENGGDKNGQDLIGGKIEEPDDEYKEDVKDDTPLNVQEEDDGDDTNIVPVDYDQNTNGNALVNSDEYKKNCPTECPAREVMVCAKCQHNIYRSFLSLCHIRAFSCKHPDEKLELVSRNPCIQSAPFLTDLPAPKGRVSEPSDRDTVLQYIYCREKGRLKDDPRCKFEEKQVEIK